MKAKGRDEAYHNYAPSVTEDTSVYGIWCEAWKQCESRSDAAALNHAYAEGRRDEAEERKAGQAVRCRAMADEVLGELDSIGTGWNEDDIDRIQGTLLPRVYDLLHLLAIAAGEEAARHDSDGPACPECAGEAKDCPECDGKGIA